MISSAYTSACGRVTLYRAECLSMLSSIPSASIDALVCDPPYSSGGFVRSDRNQTTNNKYVSDGTVTRRPDFEGDSRSPRGWSHWSTLWLSETHRIVRQGGIGMMFCDWRMLANAYDAFEAGGWLHRATIVWNKGRGARAPHKAYPRHQSEFILFGSHGPLRPATHGGPFDGVLNHPVTQADKFHTTGKPVTVMRDLVAMVPPGAVIIDPFMGSGTTGVAAIRQGRKFIGIEMSPEYFDIAITRIEAALREFSEIPSQTAPQETRTPIAA
jgi:site-specific DNA-methyltransferase (adenine-specific)